MHPAISYFYEFCFLFSLQSVAAPLPSLTRALAVGLQGKCCAASPFAYAHPADYKRASKRAQLSQGTHVI